MSATSLTLESLLEIKRRLDQDYARQPCAVSPISFRLAGMKVIESDAVPMNIRVEHYRGAGGYGNRWLIRKERVIRTPQIILFAGHTVFVRCEDAAVLRGLIAS